MMELCGPTEDGCFPCVVQPQHKDPRFPISEVGEEPGAGFQVTGFRSACMTSFLAYLLIQIPMVETAVRANQYAKRIN